MIQRSVLSPLLIKLFSASKSLTQRWKTDLKSFANLHLLLVVAIKKNSEALAGCSMVRVD